MICSRDVVQRRPRLGRGRLPRAVQHVVESRVRVAAVVLRAGRGDEVVDVAVGVDATRPADQETRRSCPRRHRLSEVTKSVDWMTTLMPTAFSSACRNCARRSAAVGAAPSGARSGRRPLDAADQLRGVGRVVRGALIVLSIPRARRRDRRSSRAARCRRRRPCSSSCGRSPPRTPSAGRQLRRAACRRSSTAASRGPFLLPMLSVSPW